MGLVVDCYNNDEKFFDSCNFPHLDFDRAQSPP